MSDLLKRSVASLVLAAVAVAAGAMGLVWLLNVPIEFRAWHLLPVAGFGVATIALMGLLLRGAVRINFAVTLVTTLIAVVLGVFILRTVADGGLLEAIDFQIDQAINKPKQLPESNIDFAARLTPHRPPDLNKDYVEYLLKLNQDGIDAFRFVVPVFLSDAADSGEIDLMPLAGVSDVFTPVCNEGTQRQFPVIRSDRFGFNNDDIVYAWDRDRIFLLGDSYGYGLCVHQDETLAGYMRRNGFAAISGGAAGSGPLMNFAVLSEYGPALKPKSVVWLYFEFNDLDDLRNNELRSRFLLQYLQPGFSQNLSERQNEIDGLLSPMLRPGSRWGPLVAEYQNRQTEWDVAGRPTDPELLETVRAGLDIESLATLSEAEDLVQILIALIRRARALTESWGGSFYFAPIISQPTYRGQYQEKHLEAILATLRADGTHIVDIDSALRDTGDPLRFFPDRPNVSHFAPDGYALAAAAILRAIEDTR